MSKVVLDVKGIVLAPGELSRAPGSLTTATNVNIEAPGIIRSRQGFARQSNIVPGPTWKLSSNKQSGSNLFNNYGTDTAATALRYGDGSAAWSLLAGTVTNQPATRMQVAGGRQNHYLTSDEGVRRVESSYSQTWFAGMPKALGMDLTGPTVLSGAPGAVLADTQTVAYRHAWNKKDADNVPMEGAPSPRTIVYNNTRTNGWAVGITKNVTCRLLLPREPMTNSTALTTSHYYRLYRSAVAAVGIAAGDEMHLVAEGFLTSTNITDGYVDVTDSTTEAFRLLGPALYTNEILGGDVGPPGADGTPITGIQLANNPPPRARDVALFADCLFFSDLIYPYAQELLILSTVAATGITAGDTITINSVVFTAIAPGAPANNQYVVATVAAGSTLFEAHERTAQNLVEAINKSSSSPGVWAYYVSEPDGLPGRIRIEQRTIAAGFAINVSARGTAFRPDLTGGINATVTSHRNGFAYSKPVLPDAVPAVNLGFAGSTTTSLLRMQVLRDAIYIFTDAGLYRLTGRSQDDFAVNEFDLTFKLRGREMLCVCDDHIYAWGHTGIAKISASGVEYVSNAIEPLLQNILKDLGATWLDTYSWSTAFQARHKVLFAVPDSSSNVNCPTILVYDTRMQAWSTWAFTDGADGARTRGFATGVARVSDDLLYFGQWNAANGDSSVFKERLTYAAADYVDDTFNTVNVALTKTVRWNAVTESPELETHWDEFHLLYDVSSTFSAWTTPTAATVFFISDTASTGGNINIAPTALSRFSRCLVSQAQRRSARLTATVIHSTASEYFGLNGMVITHNPGEGTATVRT